MLCMGLLAQEWATGTFETMFTAPVSETNVVIGKFVGSLMFFLVLLAPTLLYVVLLRCYSRPDYGPIFSGYLGIALVGALFIAIGLFCSSLTTKPVVAAVSSAAILFVITIIPWWAGSEATLSTFWRTAADQGVFARYTISARVVIDTGHLVFFITTTLLFLFLTVKVLESRRWR